MDADAARPSTPASTSKPDEPDPRASLRHVLVDPASPPPPPPPRVPAVGHLATQPPAAKTPPSATYTSSPALAPAPPHPPAPGAATQALDASPGQQGAQGPQNLAAITYTLRKNANGGVSTVYSGSKIKYLKKDDGLPFWRRDIQYAFLYRVFHDQTRVFTKVSDGSPGHTFAEIYIDAMANSSKCSQILKEKLLQETSEQSLDTAMVCLLVNVGRMNTTVNFFPEMRARVRTFHAIPCLQTHQSPQAYKQLQDGPRLKSILKGAMEDVPQPNNLEELAHHAKPRTNPVSLIFVLAQYAPRVSDLHFPAGTDFFDLFMRPTLSSNSRAAALLWIVWWYLESDFTAEDAQRNPFGPGQPSTAADAMLEGLNVMKGVPMRVPEFEILTEEEAAKENEDPPDELEYGETKRLEREAVLASDDRPIQIVYKRGVKGLDSQTPYSSSAAIDDSPSASMVEQQSNYRSHRNYSPSPTRSGDARGRLSPTSDRSFAYDERASRSQLRSGGRGHSGTPAPTIEPHSSNGAYSSLHQHGKGTPDGETRKGPGRGNYPRRIKAHSTQPFEQMYHPEQFKGSSGPTSASTGFQYGSEPIGRTILASNAPLNDGSPPSAHPPLRSSHSTYLPSNGFQPYQASSTQAATSAAAASSAPVASERPSSSAANEPQPPTKRGRTKSDRHRAVEQTRNDRVSTIINSNILAIRRAKRTERKRRGVIIDAWIKARTLGEDWDSEVEANFSQFGGIDEVRNEGGIEIPVSQSTAAGTEIKKLFWNPGDVGLQASSIARAWRLMARAAGVDETVERSRRRIRRAERNKERNRKDTNEDLYKMELELDDYDPVDSRAAAQSPPPHPASALARKAAAGRGARSDQSPSLIVLDDDDGATVTAEPTPKKKRRLGPRRQKASGATSKGGDDEPGPPPRGSRGGRGSLSGRSTRKRMSTGGDSAGAGSKDDKGGGTASRPGSFAWYVDTGDKVQAAERSSTKPARSSVKRGRWGASGFELGPALKPSTEPVPAEDGGEGEAELEVEVTAKDDPKGRNGAEQEEGEQGNGNEELVVDAEAAEAS